ncbi:MAG TPA: hypothetical protein VMJ34_23155 [Bryobacteraceae bacterium]|nr:hypothetical protein [Bryobacteraceae bacterium]
MSLKAVTLIAAITQLLASIAAVWWFVKDVIDIQARNNVQFLITQPIFLISNFALVAFLFVLFSRQKGKG